MSNPINPLSKYRSYSYHHILVVCDTTVAAENLSKVGGDGIALFEQAPDETKHAVQEIEGGNYVVLINGTTDAEFIINSLQWGTVFAPTGNAMDEERGVQSYNIMTTDGDMVILEPRGMRFLNVLVNAGNALHTDTNALIYMIKTIFVGVTDDGRTEINASFKPQIIIPFDIKADFKIIGSEYHFSFVGAVNGGAHLPQVSRLAEGTQMYIPPGTTLEGALRTFESILNDKYAAFRKQISKEFPGPFENGEFDPSKFKKVKYEFVINERYKDKGGKSNFIAGTNAKVMYQVSGNGDPVLEFGENSLVVDAIDTIMQSSQQIVGDGFARRNQKNEIERFSYKIVTAVKSTPDEYRIIYNIKSYRTYTTQVSDVNKNNAGQGQNQQGNDLTPSEGSVIEFDYFYTGKNTDILDLNLKMEMGMGFFQMLATTDNIPEYSDVNNGNISSKLVQGPSGGSTKTNPKLNFNFNTPLFPGTSLKNTLSRNRRYPLSTQTFSSLFRRYSALESTGLMVTIVGNPQLMNEMIALPSEVQNLTETDFSQPSDDVATGMWKWAGSPGLAKINIRFPATKESNNTQFVPFWYGGFYTILAVNNKFDNGEFTQEMELVSLPVMDGLFDTKDSTDTDEKKSIEKNKVKIGNNQLQTNSSQRIPQKGQTINDRMNFRINKSLSLKNNSSSSVAGANRKAGK